MVNLDTTKENNSTSTNNKENTGNNNYKPTSGDLLWIDNWEILFQKSKLTEFIPNDTMTMNEKLNAVTRFSIYLSIILYIYNKDSKSLLIAIFVMGLVFFIYNGDNQYKEHFIIDILITMM